MTNEVLKTKHVAAQFKIPPVQLRRVLRSMARYADGVHTNYRWSLPADRKLIDEIGAAIKARAKAAEVAKVEAQKKLAKTETPKAAKKGVKTSKPASDPIAERQQAAEAAHDAQPTA